MKTVILALLISGRAWALLPEEENTIKVFKDASPAVVYVTNVAVQRDVFMDVTAVPAGTGSGFLWDQEGHVVTNYHVVRGGNAYFVTLKDHKDYRAVLVGAEPRKDIAVLKISAPADRLRSLIAGDSESLQVGQKTIAIGNPFGLDNTMTTGIVSALGRQVEGVGGVTIRDMIQTDAAINPGNSGGPLLDSGGRLIGMNTIIYSRSGGSAGIGFAVPVSFIKRIVPQLIKYGKVIQPGIGVSVLTEAEKNYILGSVEGVVVRQVVPSSPAEKSGLRGIHRDQSGRLLLGDIILAVDGRKIKDFDDLYNALDLRKVGDTVSVTVVRGNKKRTVSVELVNIY